MLKQLNTLLLLSGLIFLAACAPGGAESATEPAPTSTAPAVKTLPPEEPTAMSEPTLEPAKATELPPEPYPGNEPVTSSEAVTSNAYPAEVDLSQITPQPVGETTPQVMPKPGVPDPKAAATHQVAQDLAQRLGVDVSGVKPVSAEEVEWPDSSLGCPAPGMMYMTVITPGYSIILELSGEQYMYHTDLQGNYVLCTDDGQAAAP